MTLNESPDLFFSRNSGTVIKNISYTCCLYSELRNIADRYMKYRDENIATKRNPFLRMFRNHTWQIYHRIILLISNIKNISRPPPKSRQENVAFLRLSFNFLVSDKIAKCDLRHRQQHYFLSLK